MTRALLPLLVRSQGRVVNIGSQGGSISMRYFGPYTMTKHALFAERPRRRYLVGARREGRRALAALMDRLHGANACPTVGYSLEELIDMLRERTAKEES